MAIELTNRIEGELGTSIPMGSLLNGPNIKDLAQIVLRLLEPAFSSDVHDGQIDSGSAGASPLEKVDATTPTFPLAPSQQAVWRRLQLDQSCVGNRAFAARFDQPLCIDGLRKAFARLLQVHPILNGVFQAVDGQIAQRVRSESIPDFHEHDFRDYASQEISTLLGVHAARPFNLEHGPVVRLELFRLRDDSDIVMLSVHPLVSDHSSVSVLVRDLIDDYLRIRAKDDLTIESADFTYRDYAVWEQQLVQTTGARAAEFWKRHLNDVPLAIGLPVKQSAGRPARHQGDAVEFVLDEQLSHRLLAVSAEQDASLFQTLLTAFQLLMHRASIADDLVIQTNLSGRQHRELAEVVGCFANPVLLRSQIAEDPTFAELLKQCRQQLSMVAEHQHFPIANVIEQLRDPVSGDMLRCLIPSFTMESGPGSDDEGISACQLGIAGVKLRIPYGKLTGESVAVSWQDSHAEIELSIAEVGGIVVGCWRFDATIFDRQTVEQLQRGFVDILRAVAHQPFQRPSQIESMELNFVLSKKTSEDVEGTGASSPAATRSNLSASVHAAPFEISGTTNYLADTRLDPTIRPTANAKFDATLRENVFLTGATGFLGAFLLDDLLRMTRAQVYCLVRASSAEKARQRILDNLARYKLSPPDILKRVVPVVGDLAKPRFGLAAEFERLADVIDVIYHNGAIVNLVYPYSLLKAANVGGTEEILRLAALRRLKPVHHVSTFWVQAGDDGKHREIVKESDALPPCENLPFGYSRSKWVGEKMIQQARDRGMPISIYRPGYVTGDSRTGVCNTEDFLHAIILACTQVRSVPILDMNLEITPVDFVSRATVQLSLQPECLGNTYHLVNPHPLSLSALATWMQRAGIKIRSVPFGTWKAQMAELARGAPEELIAPLMSLIGPGDGVNFGWHPRYDCELATTHLAQSRIVCPPADDRLLTTYREYLLDAGYLWDEPSPRSAPVADAMTAQYRSSDVK